MAKNARQKSKIRAKASENEQGNYHIPVMLNEAVDALGVVQKGIYFDGTLGGGGHSEQILLRGGSLIATDKDLDAIEFSKNRLAQLNDLKGTYTIVKDDFKNVKQVLKDLNVDKLDGAILDLGISSYHVNEPSRGFSYMKDGLLDMRMDRSQGFSAFDIVNGYKEDDLANLIYRYGEERFSRRIAARIVESRKQKKIETTLELSKLVSSCVPFNKNAGHAAKKTFQALRIAVNEELLGLDDAINDLIDLLKSGGKLAIITFHSLEDRIVKNLLREKSTDCICDKTVPICFCNHRAVLDKRKTKAIKPSIDELEKNPRCASAILRITEKL